jgi:hypothetical protein
MEWGERTVPRMSNLKTKKMKAALISLGILGSMFQPMSADIDLNVDLNVVIGRPIETNEVAVVESRNGPPAWAPAHGRRAKGTFIYYPAYQVYRNMSTGAWVYFHDGNWRVGVNLPSAIHIGSDSRYVSLEMNSDLPYRHHKEVAGYYPATFSVVKVSDQTGSNSYLSQGNWKAKSNSGKSKGKKK